jgi:microcystin-dependent protein
MSLPALHNAADTRSITERVNVLIRDYNTLLRVPAGCILPYAGTAAPDGFLLCAGQAVSRAAYADLFAAIGTAYGAGDGSTTFNVPDLRGRVVAGKDDMGGTDAGRLNGGVANRTTLGGAGGAATHTLVTGEMPAHAHGVNDPQHFHYYGVGGIVANGVNVRGTSGDGTNFGYAATNNSATGISIQNAGSGGAHNNTQPTIVLNYVIGT